MAKTRKKPSDDSSSDKTDALIVSDKKSIDTKKSKTSIRERNKKAAETKDKPKRIRKAATQAKKPATGIFNLLTKEYHLFDRKKTDSFFGKSRNITPRYFVDSLSELQYVTWPGRKETWKLVFAVFVFALAMGGFISILDYGLDKAFRNVIL